MKSYSLSQLSTIATNMQKYGGSFAKRLGAAMEVADFDNLLIIKNAFPEMMEEYLNIEPHPIELKLIKYDKSTFKGEPIKYLKLKEDLVTIYTTNETKSFCIGDEYLENPNADYIICGLQDEKDINVSKY